MNKTVLYHDKMQPEQTKSPNVCTILWYQSKCSSEMVKIAQCKKLPSVVLPNITRISCDHRLSAGAFTKVPCKKCRKAFRHNED